MNVGISTSKQDISPNNNNNNNNNNMTIIYIHVQHQIFSPLMGSAFLPLFSILVKRFTFDPLLPLPLSRRSATCDVGGVSEWWEEMEGERTEPTRIYISDTNILLFNTYENYVHVYAQFMNGRIHL